MASVPVRYHDLYFRIIASLIAGHFILVFGSEDSLFQLLVHWYYYRDLLLSAAIAFLLISMVYIATSRLDKLFDWRQYPLQRTGLQLLLGLLIPSLTAFLLAFGYFALLGVNIFKTHYVALILPLIVVLIMMLNVYYLAFYFFKRWQQAEQAMEIIPDEEPQGKTAEVLMVQKGAKIIPLPIGHISYIMHSGSHNLLRTSSREDFLITQSLDELQGRLDQRNFFRVNRQMIANLSACEHFEPYEFGKLKLVLNPPTTEPVIISQKRAKQFKDWINRKKSRPENRPVL